MIDYYVDHRGAGHLRRAMVVSAAIDQPVTILSSLTRPKSWVGDWVHLPLDTDACPVDQTVGAIFIGLRWSPQV